MSLLTDPSQAADPEIETATVPDPSDDSSSDPQGQQQEDDEPALTPKQLAQVEELVQRRATSIAQSFSKKTENRLQAEIKTKLDGLTELNKVLNLPADQLEKAKRQIIDEALANPPAEPEQQAQQQQQQADDNFARLPVPVQQSIRMMEQGGVIVEEGDVEFEKRIKPILESGNYARLPEFTAIAMAEKRARQASQKGKGSVRSPGGRGSARNPDDISNIEDSKELYRRGEERIRAGKQ